MNVLPGRRHARTVLKIMFAWTKPHYPVPRRHFRRLVISPRHNRAAGNTCRSPHLVNILPREKPHDHQTKPPVFTVTTSVRQSFCAKDRADPDVISSMATPANRSPRAKLGGFSAVFCHSGLPSRPTRHSAMETNAKPELMILNCRPLWTA